MKYTVEIKYYNATDGKWLRLCYETIMAASPQFALFTLVRSWWSIKSYYVMCPSLLMPGKIFQVRKSFIGRGGEARDEPQSQELMALVCKDGVPQHLITQEEASVLQSQAVVKATIPPPEA